MKHIQTSFKDLNLKEDIFLTIGNFDGIHKGHKAILDQLKKEAKTVGAKNSDIIF